VQGRHDLAAEPRSIVKLVTARRAAGRSSGETPDVAAIRRVF
jgi:hypothetical protein